MDDVRVAELKRLLPQAMLADWVRLGARALRLFKDHRHPQRHDELLQRLRAEAEASAALRRRRLESVPRPAYPADLPIAARKDEIVAALRAHPVVVIAGETGSGKTTQLPKMCLEAGLGIEARIGCTQPRRVAAQSISRRIAEELRVTWGREVGCKIRFDDRSSPETYIKLMTDGILLAETQGDPTLAEYNAIVIDEAHERSLNIDFLLGCLKGLVQRRRDLKVIVTSATIDTALFSQFFDGAPVIEVSGRTYPVEVVYRPLETASAEQGDVGYVEGAVAAVEQVLLETAGGDVLVFMPAEKDIREAADLIEGRYGREIEVVPLFGRLSGGDQQRVFAPANRRRVVVATNIAETSLTIPGIRYVIDTGLARISRYNARTRTRRLPIEAISQSSANQRRGRAGRVQAGVCIRLYAEEDFAGRPVFTQPEIQRANLAEVILRMKAFRLGEIESFPFVQPPTPAAVAGGYALLQELGALDGERALTPLGADLARLPIDPTLGRMLLQSQAEHATRELLIVASGLSIQDPRERPLDRKEAAQAAHRRFNDPKSDFLTLLNLWSGVHEEWEALRTQNQRRRFCREHFLSYVRLREWQDLHAQLQESLDGLGHVRLNESNAAYEAIHRSILAGLVGHVARREERNTYKTAGNRTVQVFPGSTLHEKGDGPRPRSRGDAGRTPAPRSTQPAWLMAGEMVETTQAFARTLAGIDPAWIVQVAPHCCKITHDRPRWQATAGRVLIDEIITLHGLEIQRRAVAYGNLNPEAATALFIRAALVGGDLLPGMGDAAAEGAEEPRGGAILTARPRPIPPAYAFLERNRAVRERIEQWRTRVRRHDLGNLDEAMFRFYAARLQQVASVHELNRFLREAGAGDRLTLTEADLIGSQSLEFDREAFPETVTMGGQPVPVGYAYAPGEEHDGVTVRLPWSLARAVSAAMVEWAVPGLREPKAAELLRALPKAVRRELMPLAPKAAEIAHEFQPAGASFLDDLAHFICRRYGVTLSARSWAAEALPAHLRPRIEILDADNRVLSQGRDLDRLKQALQESPTTPAAGPPLDWQRAVAQWEKYSLEDWSFGDQPARVTVSTDARLPVYGWPGLVVEDGSVHLRVFQSEIEAAAARPAGFRALVGIALRKDLAWAEKDLRALPLTAADCAGWCEPDVLRSTATTYLRRLVLGTDAPECLTRAAFDVAVRAARERCRGAAQRLIEQLRQILLHRQVVIARIGVEPAAASAVAAPSGRTTLRALDQIALRLAPGPVAPRVRPEPWRTELDALLPPDFLERATPAHLEHLPRYLKALATRIERARLNPAKDRERVAKLDPYAQRLRTLESRPAGGPDRQAALAEFRQAIEEFRVSLFAQELGTAFPVSAKRLDEWIERITNLP